MDLSSVRNDYRATPIGELPKAPHVALEHWLTDALQTEVEGTAFSLATCADSKSLSVRVVLAKEVSVHGVTFYTNGQSLKGRDLQANPRAAGVFFWPNLKRQVRFEGAISVVAGAEADRYFASRPRESQVAAIVSQQSKPIETYEILLDKFAALDARFAGQAIPRPAHWGGYIIDLERVEFWQGQPNRLHQRLLFERSGNGEYRQTWLQP